MHSRAELVKFWRPRVFLLSFQYIQKRQEYKKDFYHLASFDSQPIGPPTSLHWEL